MDTDRVEWLTYDAMAERLGMGRESARTLAKRKRWGRQTGNDGRVLIGVPLEEIEARQDQSPVRSGDPSPEASTDRPVDHSPEASRDRAPEVLAVLSRHIERLETQLEETTRKAAERDALAAERDVVTAQLDALRDATALQLDALRESTDRQVEALRATLKAAEQDRDRWHQAATIPAPEPRTLWQRLRGQARA